MEQTESLREAVAESELPVLEEVLTALDRWLCTDYQWPEVFEAIAHARVALDDFERALVREARVDGSTWDDIGGYVGLSRQGAQKRFKGVGVEELDALDELHQHQLEAFAAEIKLQKVRTSAGQAIDDETAADLARRSMELFNRQRSEREAVRKSLPD